MPTATETPKKSRFVETMDVCESAAGAMQQDPTAEGDFPILIARVGWTEDKKSFYTEQCLREAAAEGTFDGIHQHLGHDDVQDTRRRGHRDTRDWVATVRPGTSVFKTRAEHPEIKDDGLYAVSHAHAARAKEFLDDAFARKQIGISYTGTADFVRRTIDGHPTRVVRRITKAKTVDFVQNPNAGGRVEARESEDDIMDFEAEVREALDTVAETLKGLPKAMAEAMAENQKTDGAEKTETGEKREAAGEGDDSGLATQVAELRESNTAMAGQLDAINRATLLRARIADEEGLTATSSERVLSMLVREAVPLDKIGDRVKEACESERSYALKLLAETGGKARVTGNGGAPMTKEVREAHEEGTQAFADQIGMPVPTYAELAEKAKERAGAGA